MTAVWFRATRELRGRRWSTLAVVLVVGLAGAVGVAALAGARRTDTAYRRLLAYSRAADAEVGIQVQPGEDAKGVAIARRIARLPQVLDAGSPSYQFVGFPTLPRKGFGVVTFAAADDRLWRTFDRLRVLDGRMPRAEAATEVAISPGMAARFHLRPGSRLRSQLATLEDATAVFNGGGFNVTGKVVDLTVAGIARHPGQLSTPAEQQAADVIYLDTDLNVLFTPAFYEKYADPQLSPISAVNVRLRGGPAALPAFTKAARGVAGDTTLDVEPLSRRANRVLRATHLQAVALYAFAALALLACVVVAGQALVRQLAADDGDQPVLRAMGMTDVSLVAVSLLRAAIVVSGAVVVALVGAVAASGLFPIGLARQAEPHPGVSANVAVVVAGAVGLAVALVARALVAAELLARRTGRAADAAAQRPSRVADALARSGSPPTAVTGVRLALQPGRGAAAVPLRSTLAGSVIAVAAIAMAITFGASMTHLLETPRLQGWNWDVAVGNPHILGDPQQNAGIAAKLPRVRGVAEASASTFGRVEVNGVGTTVVGVDVTKGTVFPPVVGGREPRQRSEIALGAKLMSRLHVGVGDTVRVTGDAGRALRLHVVGKSVFPSAVAATGDVESVAPGEGAVVTAPAVRTLLRDAPVHQVFVRYDVDADPRVVYGRLRAAFGPNVLRPLRSSDLHNMAAVSWMPYVLAAVLALFALAAVGHLLVTSVRRRRRDLAVLKTVGFVRSQVSATVAWQASTMIAIALLIGLPAGVVLGRTAWRIAAAQLGVVAEPVAPSVLLLAVPAAVLIANLIAAAPGWVAGRIHPAVVLRSE